MTIDPTHFWIGETPPMPDNAYITFFENLSNRDFDLFTHLTKLNMPWWFAVDEDCYDSQSVMQREMLALFGWRGRDHYPRLYLDWKAHNKADMTQRLDSQLRFYNTWQDDYWRTIQILAMKVVRKAVDIELSPMLVGFDEMTAETVASDFDFYRFTIENKGEWGKRLIQRAEPQAQVILRHAFRLMQIHEQRTGWEFKIRHPLAFGGGYSESLINRRGPISSFDQLAPLPVNRMFEILYRFGAFEQCIDYRPAFDSWASLNCTAFFEHTEVRDTIYALTPLGFPAPLVKQPDHRLPLTASTYPTQSILDQWQRIELLNHVEVQKGEIYEAGPTATSIDPVVLNLGWLIAASATIISANLNVGQGNRKLSWLHSNINAAFVDHTMKVAPLIMRTAESSLIHV